MSDSPSILELIVDLNAALDGSATAYKQYILSLQKAREAAEALALATETVINQPHIEIKDYEIDG